MALDVGVLSTSCPGRFISAKCAPQYPLKWKLSAHQSQCGCFGEEIPLVPAGK